MQARSKPWPSPKIISLRRFFRLVTLYELVFALTWIKNIFCSSLKNAYFLITVQLASYLGKLGNRCPLKSERRTPTKPRCWPTSKRRSTPTVGNERKPWPTVVLLDLDLDQMLIPILERTKFIRKLLRPPM